MKHKCFLAIVVTIVMLSRIAPSPSADVNVLDAPELTNGQWWKAATAFDQGTMSRSTCFEIYDEYLVKISGGKPKVFVNQGKEEIICPEIANRLLGLGKGRLGIHFPLEFNKLKTVETKVHPFETITITWVGIKAYQLGQRTLEVYELVRHSTARNNSHVFDEKLLYSKECSCNVVFERELQRKRDTIVQKLFLKDFGFSNSEPFRKDVARNPENDT